MLIDYFNGTHKRLRALRKKSWTEVAEPPNVISGRGMTHPDERRLLYTLAKDYFTGKGCIVDGGTFLGSSSLALGLGLRDRGFPRRRVIQAFDMFIIDPNSVRNHLDPSDPLSANVMPNTNVRHIYDRNVAEVADYLEVHEGDMTRFPWSYGPIEILFCDISKSPATNDYILTRWLPHLMPKTGLFVQQDQIQEHHVWIAVSMGVLAEYFEPIAFVPHSTMLYRLKRRIPEQAMARALDSNLSPQAMVENYLKSMELFKEVSASNREDWHLGMVEVGLAVLHAFHLGDFDAARQELDRIKARYANVPDTMLRASQVLAHIDACTPAPGSRFSQPELQRMAKGRSAT